MQLKGKRTEEVSGMNMWYISSRRLHEKKQKPLPIGVLWIRTKGCDYKMKKSAVLGHG